MTSPKTIIVDSIEYVRREAPAGTRCIVVVDRGWIWVGDVEDDGPRIIIRNAQNLRKWDSAGFGGAVSDPSANGVVLDDCKHDLSVRADAELFRIPVPEDWGK